MRAVVIILLENETNTQDFLIRAVSSTASNPISALLLIRDYDTEVLHEGRQINKRPLPYGELTDLGLLTDGTGSSLSILVPITGSNIEKAYAILDLLLVSGTTITCSD